MYTSSTRDICFEWSAARLRIHTHSKAVFYVQAHAATPKVQKKRSHRSAQESKEQSIDFNCPIASGYGTSRQVWKYLARANPDLFWQAWPPRLPGSRLPMPRRPRARCVHVNGFWAGITGPTYCSASNMGLKGTDAWSRWCYGH